ncbi:Holliday junction resolvase RuvX [Candidatus Profftia sp. (ex Adelges kitamiensis)]|uniref:Holliday junction resolvase RuvX n=1 Tax=Candidatus Profftia sp. (ex Adelges kitamiensis) TaxID=2864218 RepID=UPI001CE3A4EF|nr:Holliday junction resolvase RuvX [Candidatus Profftia sp. (ex Adelges kitamiensis)]
MRNRRDIIAFDFGTKNIGVAVGQEVIGIAHPLDFFKTEKGLPDWSKIGKILKEWHINLVIVGLPLNIDGTEQFITTQARKFASCIHGRFGVQVVLHDERFSTVEAYTHLFASEGYRTLKKGKVDSISAAIILESWFNHQLNNHSK